MINLAQIQFAPQLGGLQNNLNKVERLVGEAKQADFIVLPELANSGYNFTDRKHAAALASSIERSDFVEMLREKSRSQNQYIVSGFHEKDGRELFNTSLFISPNGQIGKYRKIHLFMNEKQIFSKGNLGLPVFQTDDFTMGMLICFDYLFPEIWRIMALKSVEFIAHPSNLVTNNAFKVVPAQAVINRFFIFTTNRTGSERDITFSGKTFAVNPEGDVISKASPDKEEILVTAFRPGDAHNKMITEKNHVLYDRFPEDYSEIIQK
jgi:predicted amidohydrolase